MKKGDNIVVTRGKYKGRSGTYYGVATPLSFHVKLEDEEGIRTLRKTSIKKVEIPHKHDELLKEIAQLQDGLRRLEIAVRKL